jgi:hypothetical protein
MNKTLAVIGKGSVGTISVLYFLRYTDFDIHWYYDPAIPVASVGEATNAIIPQMLWSTIGFSNADLWKIDGTVKDGILKRNWSRDVDFIHAFPSGMGAIHFDAQKLQALLYKEIIKNSRIKIIENHIDDVNNLEEEFVFVCEGSSKGFNAEEYKSLEAVAVNSAYVLHFPWDYPRFNHSLTIAMKHGWVFGIPLRDRIAIGYLYNDGCAILADIKEDIQTLLEEYTLQKPSKEIMLSFNSYYRQNNFDKKIVYSGNASFFVEPLEATSLGASIAICNYALLYWSGAISNHQAQFMYEKEIKDIESMIALHYLHNNSFSSKFWEFAEKLSMNHIEKNFQNQNEFASFIVQSLYNQKIDASWKENPLTPQYEIYNQQNQAQIIGSWGTINYRLNIAALQIVDIIRKLALKYKYVSNIDELSTQQDLNKVFNRYYIDKGI